MDLATLTSFFGWCTAINVGLLLFWVLCVVAAPDVVYRTQSKWFPISREAFNVAMYSFLGLFKVFVIVFNVVPYVALLIVE